MRCKGRPGSAIHRLLGGQGTFHMPLGRGRPNFSNTRLAPPPSPLPPPRRLPRGANVTFPQAPPRPAPPPPAASARSENRRRPRPRREPRACQERVGWSWKAARQSVVRQPRRQSPAPPGPLLGSSLFPSPGVPADRPLLAS
jgi:hypothetical protein